AREVTLEGRPVKLTPSEHKLLYQLVRNEGRVMSNQALLEHVWGPDYASESDYINVYVQRLREKLEEDPRNPKMILSEGGVGYKFVGPD
ncbi:MAG: DNA-binding response regulator, partial [Chloroflexi bacterium]